MVILEVNNTNNIFLAEMLLNCLLYAAKIVKKMLLCKFLNKKTFFIICIIP